MPVFWDLWHTAKSPNGRNMLKLDCDVMMTPLEMADIFRATTHKAPDHEDLSYWLNRRNAQAGGNLFAAPRNFQRTKLARQTDIFSNGAEPSNKKLLIALPATTGMLMMPKVLFLQQFDPTEWDVIFYDAQPNGYRKSYDLRQLDRREKRYYYSVGSFEEAATAISQAISKLVDLKSYQDIVCVGASAGAGVAMRLAQKLTAARAVGIGASIEDEELIKLNPSPQTKLYTLYSEHFEKDRMAAKKIEDRFGAIPLEVFAAKKHSPFRKAIRHGALSTLLPGILDPNVEPHTCLAAYKDVLLHASTE